LRKTVAGGGKSTELTTYTDARCQRTNRLANPTAYPP
jgi:hypothetical protein